MNPFVRFILILLIAGSAIAFGIVLIADVRGARRQAEDMTREKELFSQVVQRFNGHQPHGVIGVEWQKTYANQQVTESSLLVRIYTVNADGKEIALPIERLVIPQDRVSVEGLRLNFDESFPDEYKDLRGATLSYFHFVHADGGPRRDGLALFKPYRVPRMTQMHQDRATQFELQLWQYLGDLIENPRDGRHGLEITPDPATWPPEKEPGTVGPLLQDAPKMSESDRSYIVSRKVVNGGVYSMYVGSDGAKIREEDDPALLHDMMEEAARMDLKNAQDQSSPPDAN